MPILSSNGKTLKFSVTEGFLNFLAAHHIKTSPRGRPRWKEGEILQAASGARLHEYSMHLAGAHMMDIGAFSYSMSPLNHRVQIGRYCSVGPNVRLMGARHRIESVTSSELLYRGRRGMFIDTFAEFGLADWNFADNPSPDATRIGHDVWIGQDVLIKQGVTIGTGAVVGAAALVLKDVAPYEVVGGVPAKRIRMRFDEGLVRDLLASAWWRYAIPQYPALPWNDPAAFLVALGAATDMVPLKSDLGGIKEIVKRTD
jgi:acetyltransferase-like isoleucine patch superfamily enzyme